MNILGWHLSLRKKHSDQPSSFAGVLPRVRTMREHGDWPSSTTPATREQRRERVLQARRRIIYRPESSDVAPGETPRPAWMRLFSYTPSTAWMRLLWYTVPFALLATALAWVMLATDWGVPMGPRGFTYQLPGAPTFLTEQLALDKAKESLAQVVRDPNAWTPVPIADRKVRTAPDGTPDVHLIRFTPTNPNAGTILFTSAQHPDKWWTVMLDLRGAQLGCTVSRSR